MQHCRVGKNVLLGLEVEEKFDVTAWCTVCVCVCPCAVSPDSSQQNDLGESFRVGTNSRLKSLPTNPLLTLPKMCFAF